jgi:hypothetical protein
MDVLYWDICSLACPHELPRELPSREGGVAKSVHVGLVCIGDLAPMSGGEAQVFRHIFSGSRIRETTSGGWPEIIPEEAAY